MEAASVAHEHHGPPEANRSSRVEPQLLGMLLFIISEVMIFGAFFTAYFFIRIVSGDQWFPFRGHELPVAVAGINTAILLSSSLTMHWAQTSIKNGNRFGLQAGMVTTFLLGLTFLFIQINEYVHLGFTPQDTAFGSTFYTLTGAHGLHVFVGLTILTLCLIRVKRAHDFTPKWFTPLGAGSLYWHFVDVVWVLLFALVYLL